MLTSLFLMATDQPTSHEEQHNNEPGGRIRGRKGIAKGPRKQPQRGLGVEQLERIIRTQGCWKKMNESSSGVVPTTTFPDHHHQHYHHHHDNFLHHGHPQMLTFAVQDPFGNSTSSGVGVPVRYAAGAPPPNHVQVGYQCPQQQVIHGTSVGVITSQGPFMGMGNNKSGFSLGSSGVGGWVVPNHQINKVEGAPLWSPLVGTPLETSRELSSMPNVHSQHELFDVCLKKTRFNEDSVKGSNGRKDNPLGIWPNNGPHFLGYSLQPGAPNLDGEGSDHLYNKPADATQNDDEGVEVVAVHRKGDSVSGRVFMEYEFFPGKDARGTTSKELESPTIGSVTVGGEPSSIITATPFRKTACNCNNVDLSLKLSR